MYEYKYDAETGGIILTDTTSLVSKEPRPVYAQELDYLGVDDYLIYEKQQDVPYMWAEAARYIYKGEIIFNTKGGSLYEKPTLEFATKEENGERVRTIADGTKLETIDIEAMVKANRDSLAIIEQITVKKIYDVYKRRKKSLDCFHVAFSGGKDSIVLLDLVKKALPRSSFIVVFGDTKMEFPDTYELVDKVEARCKEDGINFYRAASHLEPEESWRLFGPPSKVLRWCCSVHKAAPQTLKIREVIGKNDYVGMDFVGVRAHESNSRASYEEENFGKKQKGQYSHNPLLEWTSAEIWLYIFTHNLPINNAYKKGNSRAGCLFCPKSGGKADSFRYLSYPEEINKYTSLIKETVADKNIETYITNGGWIHRKNGRDLLNNESKYDEDVIGDKLVITITNPSTDWHEWIKTLGEISFEYDVEQTANGYRISINKEYDKSSECKLFKQVFRKAAYCVGCEVCAANCRNGCISFNDGLKIRNCIHCKQCHDIDDGCIIYHSIQLPKNGGRIMKSINTFADHAPKNEWVQNFFEGGESFLADNSLGPMQINMFRRFLSDAKLIEKHKTTSFFDLTSKLGWESEETWGLILIHLAYHNPQIKWYIDNMSIDETIPRQYIEDKLVENEVSAKDAKSIVKAFKRLTETPLGYVINFGITEESGRQIASLRRCKCSMSNEIVLLYSLYKYAEECQGYYQFNLSTLMDPVIESKGISPVKIFGFEKDELEAMLRGLSAKYNDFIDADFTHDLDKIVLRDYHTSVDVLDLF